LIGGVAARAALVWGAAAGMAAAQEVEVVRDTVGDWVIECAGDTCAISQALIQAETNQRVVTLTVQEAGGGRMAGTLQLPFGLALQAGVQLRLGGVALDAALPVSTCVPVGCLVQLGFEADVLAGFAEGDTLSASIVVLDGGEVVTFVLEMDGLAQARARASDLAE